MAERESFMEWKAYEMSKMMGMFLTSEVESERRDGILGTAGLEFINNNSNQVKKSSCYKMQSRYACICNPLKRL